MDSKTEKLIIPLNMALKMAKLAAAAEREGNAEIEDMCLKNLYIIFTSAIRRFKDIDMKNSERDMKNSEHDIKIPELDTCPCGRMPTCQYLFIQGVFSCDCLCGGSARGKTYEEMVQNWNKKVKEYRNEKN